MEPAGHEPARTLNTNGHEQKLFQGEAQKAETPCHEPARTDTNEHEHFFKKELSYKIIQLGIEIRKKVGLGFREKVYENSLMVLFRREGIKAYQQMPFDVYLEGENVGHHVADIVVEESVIVEVKAAAQIIDEHRAQALSYLRASGLRLALILNFGPARFEHERIVL